MSDSRQPEKVLVVDDDEGITQLFTRGLRPHGYAVQVAHDGPSALSAVREDPPDVVLLDVMMPAFDGYEVCRRLKRDPATRLLPVVLITALTERAQRIEGLKAGADDFLSKPVDMHELLAPRRFSGTNETLHR
jgi:DNA-binding response OmpR family regulator